MDVLNSTRVTSVSQNSKQEPIKSISTQAPIKSISTQAPKAEEVKTAVLQDDVVTLSSVGGAHPERPVKK